MSAAPLWSPGPGRPRQPVPRAERGWPQSNLPATENISLDVFRYLEVNNLAD